MKIFEKLQLFKKMITQLDFLDHSYFEKSYKMIAIDLRKQQALDTNPITIQKINFTENLNDTNNRKYFSLLKKRKKPI